MRFRQGATPQKTLERVAGLILCALANGIQKAASALRSSCCFVSYYFYCFVDGYKLDFLFRNYSMRFCVRCGTSREGKRGAPSQKDNAGKTTMGLFPSCF